LDRRRVLRGVHQAAEEDGRIDFLAWTPAWQRLSDPVVVSMLDVSRAPQLTSRAQNAM
jgi:hypothetical protein